jgi:hypothetical protein
MSDIDKKIEALAEEYCNEQTACNYQMLGFEDGIKAGIKLERERSEILVNALTIYASLKANKLIEPGHPGNIARSALAEYQAEGSGE